MNSMRVLLVTALVLSAIPAHAATILFDTDPFALSSALTTPGRQAVGGPGTEIAFDAAVDVLAFDPSIFGVTQIQFANTLAGALPPSGVNFIVLQDTGTPFLAGTAADAIADRITASGPGFFIYFNTTLQVARLVYSTDLSSDEADLAILARLTTFSGGAGLANLSAITAGNVDIQAAPEPAAVLLFGTALTAALRRRRR